MAMTAARAGCGTYSFPWEMENSSLLKRCYASECYDHVRPPPTFMELEEGTGLTDAQCEALLWTRNGVPRLPQSASNKNRD